MAEADERILSKAHMEREHAGVSLHFTALAKTQHRSVLISNMCPGKKLMGENPPKYKRFNFFTVNYQTFS